MQKHQITILALSALVLFILISSTAIFNVWSSSGSGPQTQTLTTTTPGESSKAIGSFGTQSTEPAESFISNAVVPPESNGTETEAIYPANFYDSRYLVGACDNVFVAKILRKVPMEEMTPTEGRARFEANVLYNVKGELSGKILLYGGGSVLVSGSTFVLCTLGNEGKLVDGAWYNVGSHPAAKYLLTSDSTLSDGKLSELINVDRRVKELEAAYPHEIYVQADRSRLYNAFQNLSPEDKAALQARSDEAMRWLAEHPTQHS